MPIWPFSKIFSIYVQLWLLFTLHFIVNIHYMLQNNWSSAVGTALVFFGVGTVMQPCT
jgi:hypothetical protein